VLIALTVVLAVTCAVLIAAATRPRRFRVERSVLVAAPPERVLALIEDLRAWPSWSGEKPDPTVERKYGDVARGVGAACDWDSRGSAGKGHMEIVEASAQHVTARVDWRRPFVASNMNRFALDSRSNGTLVTWVLDGENIPILKLMTLFVSADRLMGSHLERGLAMLAEASVR
jgi:uncharacterized protein YndB with AHSA1/START domain